MNSISYVVPTLNSAKTLNQTLLSLLTQVGVRVNVIVVDSDSTDSTLEICKKWGIKVLYAKPGNMYHAINTGLSQCDTEWLGYLNSDDYLYSNSLNSMIEIGNRELSDVVYGNCDYVDFFGRFIYSLESAKTTNLLSLLNLGVMGFNPAATIFRRSLFEKLGGFSETYKLAADYHFFARAFQIKSRFTKIGSLPIACFRIHDSQLSNVMCDRHLSEIYEIASELFPTPVKNQSIVMAKWRMSNLSHYLLRFFRQSIISGKLSFRPSMKSNLF